MLRCHAPLRHARALYHPQSSPAQRLPPPASPPAAARQRCPSWRLASATALGRGRRCVHPCALRPAPGPERASRLSHPSSLTCRHVVARGPRHRPDDCCRKGCTVLLATGGGGPSAGDLLTGRPAYSITAAQAVSDCGPRHTRAVRVRPPCRKATRAVASVRPSCCARNPRGVPSASHRFAFATEAVRRALVCGGRGAEKGEDYTEEMPMSNDGQRCRRLLAMINGRTKHINTANAPAGSGT